MKRVESFSSGTGSREYDRSTTHSERRYERKYHYNRDGNRRYGNGGERGSGGWVNAPLAPRFERKAAINAANAAANAVGYNNYQPYPDQNVGYNNGGGITDDNCNGHNGMDMEDLPNGFTKVLINSFTIHPREFYLAQF